MRGSERILVVALLLAVALLLGCAGGRMGSAWAAEYHVAPDGDDGGPGTADAPWRTIAHAAATARAGDTVHVASGTYAESVRFTAPGTAEQPIRFVAEGEVLVDAGGADWGLFVDGYLEAEARWIVLEGFRVTGAARGGIRVSWAEHVTVRDCTSFDNQIWGIFTDYADDLLLEGNVCSGSVREHGIYISNSGDRPVVRNNICYGNAGSGIQLNADPQMEGDGIISEALVEGNICHGSGALGGAALNLASVRDSVFRNNLLHDNLAGGIAAWGDGNGPAWGCKNNRFYNNIVYFAPGTGRWCLSLKEGSTGNLVRNNILIGGRRGAIEFTADSLPGLVSDYNLLAAQDGEAVATEEDVAWYDFAQWQAQGYDAHSRQAGPTEVFRDHLAGDFHHRAGGPAIDCGSDEDSWIPARDREGRPRVDDPDVPNAGSGGGFYDLGCYERQSGAPAPSPTPAGSPTPSPGMVELALEMGAQRFREGDTCRLELSAANPGPAVTLDLYVLLDVFGEYWLYPDWTPLDQGLTHGLLELAAGETRTLVLIPEFTMPPVSPLGPLFFHAAAFSPGEPSLETLRSNVASFEFHLE
jgi:parallel beta-helix repeat protein